MKFVILGILLIALSACSALDRRADKTDMTVEAPLADGPPPQSPPIDESKPLTDGIASPLADYEKDDADENETIDVTLTKKSFIDEKYHEPKTETIPAETPDRVENVLTARFDGVEPEKALTWLKNGNKRFIRGALRADGQSKKDILRLREKEKPHAVIFSSSDSRIPPEIIFDEKLGEIYVIRNLGLIVDTSVLNSVDYAVGQLGARLVIVLDRTYPQKGIDFTHADQTAQKLVDRSQVLMEGLNAKKIKIIPSVYDLETGKVTFGK